VEKFFTAKNNAIMVIEIDKTVTPDQLKQLLETMKSARAKTARNNFSEFFGALPHIEDGLKFQKTMRSEWD
jgi:16S rRNA A1518/A1519 N6-dimethyltransferase RsmA/KsgA/DIM1 with predicted DNA glycosylase/AP lyase activity